MPLGSADIAAIWLTLKLASLTTVILLIIGTPIALWLARTDSWLKGPIGAVVALPLVLPPTVIGFLPVAAARPQRCGGSAHTKPGAGYADFQLCRAGDRLGSVLDAFCRAAAAERVRSDRHPPSGGRGHLTSWPLGHLFHVILPLAKPGFITAAILGFAHTVGEFGVVLMIGGNIPEKTRVVSVQIFDHVESMEYLQAHWLAGAMLVFSFLVLLALYSSGKSRTGWS